MPPSRLALQPAYNATHCGDELKSLGGLPANVNHLSMLNKFIWFFSHGHILAFRVKCDNTDNRDRVRVDQTNSPTTIAGSGKAKIAIFKVAWEFVMEPNETPTNGNLATSILALARAVVIDCDYACRQLEEHRDHQRAQDALERIHSNASVIIEEIEDEDEESIETADVVQLLASIDALCAFAVQASKRLEILGHTDEGVLLWKKLRACQEECL